MSATLNCCNSCATTETVNIPGSEGTAGVDGVNGINAFSTLTTNLLIPAVGLDVNGIGVGSTLWMVVGQIVIVGEGVNPSLIPNGWAHFRVAGIVDTTTVNLTAMDYDGDTAAGQTLSIGCTISPAGVQGPAGP